MPQASTGAALSNEAGSTQASMRGGCLPRLIAGHIFLHSSMVAMRMATPLLALRMGHSALHVGLLLAFFSLSQVFLSLPAGRFAEINPIT